MSYAYPPATGGMELFSSLMREALQVRGHTVRVVTEVDAPMIEDRPHRVERQLDKPALKQAVAWADLCFVSGVSMHYQIPALLARKPLVVTHHGWQHGIDGKAGRRSRLKRFLCGLGLNIAVSRAVAADLPVPSLVLHNPVHCDFQLGPEFAFRSREVVFVGRLVSEKGVNVLIDALAHLRDRGRMVTATIIGDGKERSALERQANLFGLRGSVVFRGHMELSRIHQQLLDHSIMAVPTLAREGFSMAALEGLAAGCVVLGSNAGGLPEAIGPCGLTFPPGDSSVLAALIEDLLAHPESAAAFRAAIPAHLDLLHVDRVADRYVEVFERLYAHHVEDRMSRRKAIRQTLAEMGNSA